MAEKGNSGERLGDERKWNREGKEKNTLPERNEERKEGGGWSVLLTRI